MGFLHTRHECWPYNLFGTATIGGNGTGWPERVNYWQHLHWGPIPAPNGPVNYWHWVEIPEDGCVWRLSSENLHWRAELDNLGFTCTEGEGTVNNGEPTDINRYGPFYRSFTYFCRTTTLKVTLSGKMSERMGWFFALWPVWGVTGAGFINWPVGHVHRPTFDLFFGGSPDPIGVTVNPPIFCPGTQIEPECNFGEWCDTMQFDCCEFILVPAGFYAVQIGFLGVGAPFFVPFNLQGQIWATITGAADVVVANGADQFADCLVETVAEDADPEVECPDGTGTNFGTGISSIPDCVSATAPPLTGIGEGCNCTDFEPDEVGSARFTISGYLDEDCVTTPPDSFSTFSNLNGVWFGNATCIGLGCPTWDLVANLGTEGDPDDLGVSIWVINYGGSPPIIERGYAYRIRATIECGLASCDDEGDNLVALRLQNVIISFQSMNDDDPDSLGNAGNHSIPGSDIECVGSACMSELCSSSPLEVSFCNFDSNPLVSSVRACAVILPALAT